MPDISVNEYIKQDRQWFRSQRIQHARYQLSIAKDQKEKNFWRSIIEANMGD